MNAVIDTNVVIAALLSRHDDAATVRIMLHVLNGNLIPVYSESILTEYQDVLKRKKFKFPKEDQDYIVAYIKKFGFKVQPLNSDVVLPDIKDIPFYDASKCLTDCYLVTGNKRHFPIDEFIVSPKEMLDKLEGCEKMNKR
ncbi:MAG: putative toxin-antitoxin system toxin component, PIN family [Selenomonadaceae bacterium]|nr:putative toxin-antitoxin system toxin component, PIN family [Selenomonadaceae bacterium]